MNQLNFKKILVIKHGSLGDIVFALEPILAIQKKFNDSVIDIVTEEKFIPFFKKIKMFDQFLIDNRKGFLSSVMKKINNIKFMANAPQKVVETELKKKADAENQIKILESKINSLKQ